MRIAYISKMKYDTFRTYGWNRALRCPMQTYGRFVNRQPVGVHHQVPGRVTSDVNKY